MTDTNSLWNADYSQIELRILAEMSERGRDFRKLYMCEFPPPTFEEVAWHKMRARPATFSWGDPIPGLWNVPDYPELTTAQLEQIMRDKGLW